VLCESRALISQVSSHLCQFVNAALELYVPGTAVPPDASLQYSPCTSNLLRLLEPGKVYEEEYKSLHLLDNNAVVMFKGKCVLFYCGD
jgi:hypothetical protein